MVSARLNKRTLQMNTPNLVLHCGANAVERTALSGVVIPKTTESYKPLPYCDFVDMVEDQLQEFGFRFGNEAHALMKDGSRYFGIASLLNGKQNEQHALVVGMRSSLDKSIAPSIAFGADCFVCDNLSFTGEVVISRKQTRFIGDDIRPLIYDAVSNVTVMQQNQDRRFEIYQNTKVLSNKAGAVICEMYRRGIVNTTKLGKVIEEWDNPKHDFGGRTAWRLFNATTEALKGTPVLDMPQRTIKLQTLLDEVTDAPRLLKAA